jgi:hypothetical protein
VENVVNYFKLKLSVRICLVQVKLNKKVDKNGTVGNGCTYDYHCRNDFGLICATYSSGGNGGSQGCVYVY